MDKIDSIISHVDRSFTNAELYISNISQEILDIHGMTGEKTRHFYNNLLNVSNARYLEIGTWKGSSVCSAMYNNSAKVVCIDNWSQFEGPKDEFLKNFNKFKGKNDAIFIEDDCFKVDVSSLPKFNIYMYDGEHSHANHYNALVHYYECLDNTFIFIIDDWNWSWIRDATLESLKKLDLKVLFKREIISTDDNTHPPWGSPKQKMWHNGICVFVLQKTIQTPSEEQCA
jgi:hypothetical protein